MLPVRPYILHSINIINVMMEETVPVAVELNSNKEKLHLNRTKRLWRNLGHASNSVIGYPSVRQRDSLWSQYSQY